SREEARRTGDDKTTLSFALRDAPGALRRALEIFDAAGVNLSRIESRPSRHKVWEYVFLVDVAGHREDEPVARAVTQLRAQTEMVCLHGSYPRFASGVGGLARGLDGGFAATAAAPLTLPPKEKTR